MSLNQTDNKQTGGGQRATEHAAEHVPAAASEKTAKEKPNSLVAFLRAIRFKRETRRPLREGPRQRFAGLSSARNHVRRDELDCIRSAN